MTEEIPLPQGPIVGQPCAWCGHRPAKPYELEKSWTSKGNGTRVPKKTITAWACEVHRRLFDGQR